MEDALVNWTARLAVAAYLVRLWYDLCRPASPWGSRARIVWTIGCLCHLLHVAAAFQFVHHWSHTAAYEDTARQTAALTGWHWGGGLWINYVFTLWWPLDVAWVWRRGLDQLPRWYIVTMHLSVGFLVFNATVVFGPLFWRWLSVPVAVVLTIFWRSGRFGSRKTDHSPG